MKNKNEILCEAVKVINDEWTLKQLARFIYNLTNEKQNGPGEDSRAAEIVKELTGWKV